MIRFAIFSFFVFLAATAQAQDLQVWHLECEYGVEPLGVESLRPGLHWELRSDNRNVLQSAYRILVADDSVLLQKNAGNIWDSRKINSDSSAQVAYKGKSLKSAKKYFWKVMVWDNKGNHSAWSKIATWQMGLLDRQAWNGAKWIGYERLPDSEKIVPAMPGNGKKQWGKRLDVLPLFRKSFPVSKDIKRATAFICGLGQFEMSINGKKVGDHFLDPGWTNYDKQALYVTFNITSYLKHGVNAVGVMLGNGFYYIPGERYRKMTGAYGYPEMIARILIEYNDGSTENIISDNSWKTAPSPITFSSLYGGEDYDAILEQRHWNEPGFNDNNWKPVVLAEGHILHSQMANPIKVMQEFTPVSVNTINDNVRVYDMGQNMSGIPKITVTGNRGDTVRITTAELLRGDGTINQKASGSPSYYQYILKGGEDESWHPRFSYYGFRYVQVEIFPGTKNENSTFTHILAVKGLHTRNSAATVGEFECSNDLFNKTFSLIKWAINSNMQSIFTDCPHRERLGWQEEDHLMGNSIQYNYDIHPLAEKVLADIRVEQNNNGLVPSTVPEYAKMDFVDGYFRDSPEWGSNAVIFPWYLYQWYGDKDDLKKNYATMQRYVNYLHSRESSYLLMYGLGDWYDLGPARPGFSQLTPMGLTATAYYYYDLTILGKVARMFGQKNDVVRYSQWADSVKRAFNKMFYHPATKEYGTGSQTSNAISVYMGLADEEDKNAVIENIIKDIRKRNYSLTSGDIGFRYLLKVLEDAGRSDIIFAMNNRTDVPGYGYQIAKGATALTESWQASPTASNNHLMLGHLMEWFYEGLAGIKPGRDGVAYKKIQIRPEVVGDITFVKASYHSVYGWIKSAWQKKKNGFDLDVEIPANTTAEIYMPASPSSEIKVNDVKLTKAIFKNDKAIIKIGSGKYHFNVSPK